MTTATEEDKRVEELRERVRALEGQLAVVERERAELDRQCLALENEAAQRGVKLSCAKVALARAKIAFDETSRSREEMVQEVAHDLRTPLTSIKGAAQNLLDGIAGPLEPSAEEYVDIIREHSDRLVGVVNWLVKAMVVTAEPLELEETEHDVGDLTAGVTRGLRPLARQRKIELIGSCDSVRAKVDAEKLRKVIENLVGNALKFTPEGGRVEVRVEGVEDDVVISVEDSGIGLSADELGRIFDRYYRSRIDAEGTGLGLVISREIVRLHGGDITVESRPDEGSRFIVRLPAGGRRSRRPPSSA